MSGVVARYVSAQPRPTLDVWLTSTTETRHVSFFTMSGGIRCYLGSEASNGTKVEAKGEGRNRQEAFELALQKLLSIFSVEDKI